MSDFGHFRELWATACVASGWQGKGGNKHLGGKGTGPEKGQAGRVMAQRRYRRERGPGRDGAEREGRNERQKSGSEMEQEGERPGKGWAERGWEGRSSRKISSKVMRNACAVNITP